MIEIPLCVGNANKILHVLQIEHPSGGFPINAQVKVVVEINADKVLLAQGSCMGISCVVTPQNPFANKELTTEERIVLVAERQANLEAEQNGGVPSKQSLIKLKDAYLKAGNDFRAAETLEQMNEMYQTPNEYNQIGVLYHNSGNYEKAVDFYERALANNPNDFYPTFNLGNTLSQMGSQYQKRSEEYIRKAHSMRPEHCPTLINMAKIEQRQGNSNKAREYQRKAYDILYQRWKTNSLQDFEYSWLSSVADSLGERAVAAEVRRSKPGIEQEQYFNADNLTRTKINAIERI